jgi:hypothetical protein
MKDGKRKGKGKGAVVRGKGAKEIEDMQEDRR